MSQPKQRPPPRREGTASIERAVLGRRLELQCRRDDSVLQAAQVELFPNIAELEGTSMRARGLLTDNLRHDAMGELGSAAGKTYCGQASWADESIGKTCSECALYTNTGGPKKRCCLKYRAMMKQWGAAFPSCAIACKFFEARAGQ
jgi:hypothetical protein